MSKAVKTTNTVTAVRQPVPKAVAPVAEEEMAKFNAAGGGDGGAGGPQAARVDAKDPSLKELGKKKPALGASGAGRGLPSLKSGYYEAPDLTGPDLVVNIKPASNPRGALPAGTPLAISLVGSYGDTDFVALDTTGAPFMPGKVAVFRLAGLMDIGSSFSSTSPARCTSRASARRSWSLSTSADADRAGPRTEDHQIFLLLQHCTLSQQELHYLQVGPAWRGTAA